MTTPVERQTSESCSEPVTRPLRLARTFEAGASAACTASVIVWRFELPALVPALLAFAAAVLTIDLARREHAEPSSITPTVVVIAALLVVAVVRAPNFPTDIRSYAADGRMLAHYHANPYLVRPSHFHYDPMYLHIPNSTAPYGPLFIGPAAVLSRVAGTSEVWTRLAYQAAAGAAIAVALVVLWRSCRSSAAIVLVGLHPVVAGTIVNGGHNDAFVGLFLLVAVLAAERKRFASAGLVLAAAMLIKITAGLALLPLTLWAARRGRRVAWFLGVSILVMVVPVILFVPGLVGSIRSADFGLVTRTSIWNLDPVRAPRISSAGDGAVTQLALLCIGLAVIWVAWGQRELSDRVTGCVAAWLLLSAYVMPWYTVWALPVAALHPRHPFTRVVAWQGAIVVTAFLLPRRLLANHAISLSFGWIAPAALLAAFAFALRGGAPGNSSRSGKGLVRARDLGRSLPSA